MLERNLYAALIGINAYEKANSLDGCIKDVLNFDHILRSLCNQQKGKLNYKPLYFLSPHESDREVIEDYKKEKNVDIEFSDPSFKNVSGIAFDHLGKVSGNDICLLYFSGHGSFIRSAPEFWHAKPSHQSETLVCMDSRSNARDLIDKELAFLLDKTLKNKPDVHCLVITDCCHSGSNTRAINLEAGPVRYRQESPSNQQVAIENYLGYKENFFEIKNGKAEFKIGNYVHFAACRDHEKAVDSFAGGLFSRKLAELLNNGGKNSSYRNMEQSLAATISIQNGLQNPVAFCINDDNLDKQFLGGNFIPYTPGYEVRYINSSNAWQLQAGSMQGIVPSAGSKKTLVNIEPLNIEAEVVNVGDFTATLKGDELVKLDKKSNEYKATVKQLAIQKQVIGISMRLRGFPELVKKLSVSFKNENYVYFELDMDGSKKPDFMADVSESQDKQFYLSQTRSDIPLFKSEADATKFLTHVNSVCKWVYVKNLQSKDSIFGQNDFVFTASIIEGESITPDNIDSLTGRMNTVKPGSQIDLSYKNDLRPVLKFTVEINPGSKLNECYIQALYLDNLYGIKTDYSEPDHNHLVKGGKFELQSQIDEKYYGFIRLELDEEFGYYNINEIVEQLKIFVSAKPNIELNGYAQKSLESAFKERKIRTRGTSPALFDSAPKARWAVFNFNVRIIGPKKDIELVSGGETGFPSFNLEVPAGFKAIGTVVTNADLQTSTRSVTSISPPIWGNTLTENAAFDDVFGSMSSGSVVALELGVKEGEQMPFLKEGEKLIIRTKKNAAVTRSIDGYESTIIPYGYDEDTQLYFPLGYEDKSGDIHIEQLPKASTGSLVGEAVTTRSIFGSIKLYFKKLLRLPTDTFTLHTYSGGQWQTTTHVKEMGEHLRKLNLKKLPLIIHGIFGDTEGMIEGLKEDNDLSARFPAILSYDFENLSTKASESAKALKHTLENIGIGGAGIPKLTIIAHSMGGLVSRWMIEKLSGANLVEKLIMAGTPNGGSEWSEASGKILNGAKFLLTHALNVAGPIKYAITGISFFIKKFHDPQSTLKDMGTDSQMIQDLAGSSPPASVSYFLIGSDTGLFREYEETDVFLTKVKNLFMKKIAFPGFDLALFHNQPNDMAVTLDSMKFIPGFDFENKMKTLPGDHISYFSDSVTRKAILDQAFA